MSLLSRLVSPAPGEDKLPVHQFMAALAELKRGVSQVSIASIASFFNLSAGEQTDLQTFVDQQAGDVIAREEIHDVLMLGEVGAYTLQNCSDRLATLGAPNPDASLLRTYIVMLRAAANDVVLSGGLVSAQGSPNMTVAVAKAAVLTGGNLRAVAAGNATIGAADANLPRMDVVVVDASGAIQTRAGTPARRAQAPTLTAGDVALCIVYVERGATSIVGSRLTDVRVVQTTGPIVVGKRTTLLAFNNTNAAQTYASLVLPSGLFLAGKALRVKCGGTMLLNSGAPTVTLAISYGGTTMFQDVSSAATADADRLAWNLEFVLQAQANNDQALNGRLVMSPFAAKTAATAGVGDLLLPAAIGSVPVVTPINGAAAVDSDAGDRTLNVQWTMSVANAANEVALEYATAELL